MNAGLYHRASTPDQDPTIARAELRELAVRRGYAVALDVEETGSGARNDRPGLQQVLEAARRGKVRVVLVWKLDRFGRSLIDLLANIEMLTKAGCTFVAITQGLEIRPGGDSASMLLLRMLGAVAEYERDLIRERTVLGMAAARRRGVHVGRPRVDVPTDLVAAVAALRQQGAGWPTICRMVEEAGHPASEDTLRRLIKAAAAAQGETHADPVPPRNPGDR